MRLRRLRHDDSDALLAFERDNRHWFERFIESRGEAFYSARSVADHVRTSLAEHADGVMFPGLVVQGGALLGRVNLREIDRTRGTARLGYRVAENAAGQGVGRFAVSAIVDLARTTYKLRQLTAFVSVDNPASRRVLERQGFRVVGRRPGMAEVGPRRIDCLAYQIHLSRR
ncbi:GNAT family N-acetyltransferase [Marinobacter sp. JSM 1782161]|uniref:GNAT family N-acetyltransferase n=1 Tax=Marinobacter sp. JSM 1782161 TaxID=2685906 RepID=UPI0014020077|nr:GNAT family N-acetyltransferase [Marinobacter sp. JSM 1782161]